MKTDFNILFPDHRSRVVGEMQQAQQVMLRILKVIDHICREHKIMYWLDGGTLLGAVRHKGFIPWDDDIDIAMLREDYEHFLEIASTELPDDMFMQTQENDLGFCNMIVPLRIRDNKSLLVGIEEDESEMYNQGIFVDIFAYDYLPENKFKRKMYKKLGRRINKYLRYKLDNHAPRKSDWQYKIMDFFFCKDSATALLKKAIKYTNSNYEHTIGFGLDSSLKRTYEKEKFFPLIALEFEGTKFLAPKDYDYYLKTTYGDYMTLPPESDRKPHHHKVLIPSLGELSEH